MHTVVYPLFVQILYSIPTQMNVASTSSYLQASKQVDRNLLITFPKAVAVLTSATNGYESLCSIQLYIFGTFIVFLLSLRHTSTFFPASLVTVTFPRASFLSSQPSDTLSSLVFQHLLSFILTCLQPNHQSLTLLLHTKLIFDTLIRPQKSCCDPPLPLSSSRI